MEYSAKDLFQDWYAKSLKKEVSSEEIGLRRKTIDRLLKKEPASYWFDCTRMYFNLLSPENVAYKAFVDEFKKEDENFPVEDNQHIVQVLAGCLLAQKLEQKRSYLTDTLTLSLLTGKFLRARQDVLPEVLQRADKIWKEECLTVRNQDGIELSEIKASTIGEIKLPALEAAASPHAPDYVTATVANTHVAAVKRYIVELQKDSTANYGLIGEMHTALHNIINQIDALAEETNVLWWLFGGYSDILKQPFAKFDKPVLSLALVLELASLTKHPPGLVNLNSILHKAFSLSNCDPAITMSFVEIINYNKCNEISSEAQKKFVSELKDFTPCIAAFYNSVEYRDSWETIFGKGYNNLPEQKIALFEMGEQLYREIMLCECFKNL